LISGAHAEHPISCCAASGLARVEEGYMEAQTPVYLTSLLTLHGTLHHGNECLKKSPRFISVSGIHEVLVLLEDTLLR
jgi:hypothetical protein